MGDRKIPRKIRDAAELAIIEAATDFGHDRTVAGDSLTLAVAALEAALPLIERDVRRQVAREILTLAEADARLSHINKGPWGDVEGSVRRLARGEPLPDAKELRGGAGAQLGAQSEASTEEERCP